MFFETLLLKDWICRTCLQHKFPNFEKHLVENLPTIKIESSPTKITP